MDKTVVEKAKAELDSAQSEAKTAWAKFVEVRDGLLKEHGAEKVAGDAELFKTADDTHRVYSEAAEKADQARDRYVRFVDMLGTGDLKDLGLERRTDGAGREKVEAFKTYGDRYVDSASYKELLASGRLNAQGSRVDTSPVIFGDAKEAKTLVTGLADTQAGAFVINDRKPGVIELLREAPRIIDLITVGQTDSDTVEWVEQDGRTNSAAEALEATSGADGALAESGFTLVIRSTLVQSVGHFIPVTKRALSDAGQVRTLIDQELIGGLRHRLDGQLLNGNGTTPNLRGILNTAGIQTQAKGVDSRSDATHKALTKVRLAFLEADAIAMHPTDFESVRLEKGSDGQYIYGPPSIQDATRIWGLPVILTTRLAQGTALLGAWRNSATLWLREGIAVSATDAHSDWFIRNIVAVKADMRCAFGVARPGGFCTVTGL